jgi:hypothetical protein
VKRVFGRYAEERNVLVEIDAEADLMAPLVPAALYNGLALNLFTNALKAVTAKSGREQKIIAFRAWNDSRWHHLEVSDTGIGIPSALHDRVFDPLFTTTASQNDPLGSGMGLGLSLVRRAEANEDHVQPLLRNVRTPSAQMDIFSVIAQICADHLIHEKSGIEVRQAFAKMRSECNFFIGAAHRMTYLNADVAPICYRSTHWYTGNDPASKDDDGSE